VVVARLLRRRQCRLRLGGDDTVTRAGPGIGTAIGSLEPNGWFGGGQIGYNAQFQSLVFGLEADIQGADISDGVSGPVPGTAYFATADTTVDWFSTLRGRVGYDAGPALLYNGRLRVRQRRHARERERRRQLRLLKQQRREDRLCARRRYRVGVHAQLGTETDFHTVRVGLNYHF
jgi:opacity protein-like surface antigen